MPLFAPAPDVIAGQLGEDLASALVDTYSGIEARLTAEIARRLRKGLAEYPELDEQLRTIRDLRVQAERLLDTVDTEGLATEAVNLAIAEGTAAAAARLGLARFLPRPEGIVGMAAQHADALSLIALDLQNKFDEMHLRILRNVGDDYQRTIARMAPDLIAGVTTHPLLQQRIVTDFLQQGISSFTSKPDAFGRVRNWKIGTYTEMATRTATARAWNDASIYRMQESGINLVVPVVGRGACIRCSAWAGKILSTDGTPAGQVTVQHATEDRMVTVTIAATLEEARAAGLHHPNCGCVETAYLPGLDIPADATTHEPELEQARTKLRALEVQKRSLQRQQLGAADDVTRKRYGKRIRDVEANIRAHVDETGIQRQPYRERLSWADGKPPIGPVRGGGATRPPARPDAPKKPAARKPTIVKPADTRPEYVRRHEAAVGKLPTDRTQIGWRTEEITPAVVRASRVTEAERMFGGSMQSFTDVIEQGAQRAQQMRDLLGILNQNPPAVSDRWSDEARDLARSLGIIRRKPIQMHRALLDTIRQQEAAVNSARTNREYLQRELDRLATLSDRQIMGGVQGIQTRRVVDLDAKGNLGPQTRAHLAAIDEAGGILDDEIERRTAAMIADAQVAASKVTHELDPMRKLFLNDMRDRSEARWIKALDDGKPFDEVKRLRAEYEVAQRELEDALEQGTIRIDEEDLRRKAVAEVLAEVRSMGAGTRSVYRGAQVKAAMTSAMEKAHQHYPSEWNTRNTERFPNVSLIETQRGFNQGGTKIALSNRLSDGYDAVATHELGHSMELSVPGLRGAEWAYHYDRSTKVLGKGGTFKLADPESIYGRDTGMGHAEVAVPDEWANPYVGKVYGNGRPDSQWEVFTMGSESLFNGSEWFNRYDLGYDRGFRRWMLGVLGGL